MNKTRRNLTTEYLNLNFATKPKLTTLHWFFAKKDFISCVWFIPVSLVRTTSKHFRYRYFAEYYFGFKVFNQIVNRQTFQLVKSKNFIAWENEKEMVEGLESGSFVTVTNLAPRSCGCREILPGKFFLITRRVWRFLRHA